MAREIEPNQPQGAGTLETSTAKLPLEYAEAAHLLAESTATTLMPLILDPNLNSDVRASLVVLVAGRYEVAGYRRGLLQGMKHVQPKKVDAEDSKVRRRRTSP